MHREASDNEIRFLPGIKPDERARYQYVIQYVLGDRLGLRGLQVEVDRQEYRLGRGSHLVRLPNIFLSRAVAQWGRHSSMDVAEQPTDGSSHPFISNEPSNSGARHASRADLLGAIFFVLTRYDEWVSANRDRYGRFLARHSYVGRNGLLGTPVVDQWIDELNALLPREWPRQARAGVAPRVRVSCDVDWPFRKEQISLARAAILSVRRIRLGPRRASRPVRSFLTARRQGYQEDDFRRAVTWMMDVNEELGNRVAFYFIPKRTSFRFDNALDYASGPVQSLIREIDRRGHEIGIHPGFATASSQRRFQDSVSEFRRHLGRLGLKQDSFGGRQHYLRWDPRHTAYFYEAAGLSYDSTLGFADSAGFRCGTSHEHRLFDLQRNRELDLIERPLIAMDSALIGSESDMDRVGQRLASLKQACQRHGGSFTVLWHNSLLLDDASRTLYRQAISP